MSKRWENICLTALAVLVGMLLMQILSYNSYDLMTAASLQAATQETTQQTTPYQMTSQQSQEPSDIIMPDSSASISGLQSEVNNADAPTMTIIRDHTGKQVISINKALPVSWSPTQDVLLLHKNGEEGGFLLYDLSVYAGSKKIASREEISSVFGQNLTSAAVFSINGQHVLIAGKDGIIQTMALDDLLPELPVILTAALWEEENSILPDIPLR